MKKIIYIATLIAAIFATASCAKETVDEAVPEVSEGKEVTIACCALVPDISALTKSLGEVKTINSLYVIAFDDLGYYVESEKAVNLSTDADGFTTFNVTLHATTEKRILHFIANYDMGNISYASESNIIARLETKDADDAYWQRVVLANGIPSAANTLPTELKNPIPLIRNFAKITVSVDKTVTDFTLEGFIVVNVPDIGTVAPYNTAKGTFPTYIDGTTYADLQAQGYAGFSPSSMALLNTDPSALTFGTDPYYLYEHAYTGESTTYTYVIIKGTYKGSSYYYKIDLVHRNGSVIEYYDILRNFNYKVNITNVSAIGASSVTDAADGIASNNLSSSVDIENLTNVSDGEARLYVSYTSKTLVSANQVTLLYKYIPSIESPTVTSNGDVSILVADGGNVISNYTVASSDVNGWRTITITPKDPAIETKTQVITVAAPTLSRNVLYILKEKFNMTAECVPYKVAYADGEELAVDVTVPEGLPESMFPLKLYFSSAKNSIYPDSNKNLMAVEISDGTYSFLYSLSYEDYKAQTVTDTKVTVPVYFKTNRTESATTVYVRNEYFNDATCSFVNVRTFKILANSLSVSGLGFTSRTVKIYSSDPGQSSSPAHWIGDASGYSFDGMDPTSDITISNFEFEDEDIIYFRYEFTTANGKTIYANASASAGDLINGTLESPVDLTFVSNFSEFTILANSLNVTGLGDSSKTVKLYLGTPSSSNQIGNTSGYAFDGTDPTADITVSGASFSLDDVITFRYTGTAPNGKEFTADASASVTSLAMGTATAQVDLNFKLTQFTIASGTLNNSLNNRTRVMTIYSSDPGNSFNPENQIGTYTFKNNQDEPKNDIDILNSNLGLDDLVYFRYYSWSYYVASAKVSDILNATTSSQLSMVFTKQ